MVTPEIIIVLFILVAAIVLFVTEVIRLDLTAMLIMVSLGLTGILTPAETFSGFSNEAVLAVLGILIMGIGLERSGAVDLISNVFGGNSKKSYSFLIVIVVLCSALLSSVMNNVVAVAILLPAVMRAATVSKISPSKLLIPLAFGSIFGGMLTLIGTPPNLIVSSELSQHGLPGFKMFDFFPIGIVLTFAGLIYFLTLGKRLLPDNPVKSTGENYLTGSELIDLYKIDRSLYETIVPSDSDLVNKTLFETGLGQHYQLNVIALISQTGFSINPDPERIIKAGDKLILTGSIEALHSAETDFNISIFSPENFSLKDIEGEQVSHVEAVISPRSDLEGKTLKEVKFRERFGVNVIAIWRGGDVISSGVGDKKLTTGDALLIQGARDKIKLLQDSEDLILLVEPDEKKVKGKSFLCGAIFVLSILPAVLGLIPISIAALGGAVLIILTGCISIEQVYKNLQWKIIFLMAGIIPLGIALQKTGATDIISDTLLKYLPGNEPVLLLAIVFILTVALCVTASNNTAALIMTPIAYSKAVAVGLDPSLMMLLVAFASSTSYLTPVAQQSNVLVMGTGGYSKSDYFKIGLPLTIISGVVIITMLLLLYM